MKDASSPSTVDERKAKLLRTAQAFAALSQKYEEGSWGKWGAETMATHLLEQAFLPSKP